MESSLIGGYKLHRPFINLFRTFIFTSIGPNTSWELQEFHWLCNATTQHSSGLNFASQTLRCGSELNAGGPGQLRVSKTLLTRGIVEATEDNVLFMTPKHITDTLQSRESKTQQSKICALNPPQAQQRPVKACKWIKGTLWLQRSKHN